MLNKYLSRKKTQALLGKKAKALLVSRQQQNVVKSRLLLFIIVKSLMIDAPLVLKSYCIVCLLGVFLSTVVPINPSSESDSKTVFNIFTLPKLII